jgi:mono/diheme cytochrome c family protein
MSPANFLSQPKKSIALLLHVAMVLVLLPELAAAQVAGDPEAGHKLAQTWCDSCHVVDPAQTRGTSNGAPPFTAVAAMKSTTFMSLQAFLQTPHNRMPDLHLSHDEIDDVAAYILSLKR